MKDRMLFVLLALSLGSSCKKETSDLIFKSSDDLFREEQLIIARAPLNFRSLQRNILRPKCMACHSGPNAKPKNDPIDFTTYESTMVDRFIPLLVKGKPEKSRLYLSVESGEMPINGTLTDIEIEFIKKWIGACAPKTMSNISSNICNNDDEPSDDEPGDEEPQD